MIQIGAEQYSTQKLPQKPEVPSENSYLINRIFYSFILIVFLLLISLYFDLLHEYDAVSLMLGFVICIILQFMALSYHFKDEIDKFKMDEISVLKMNIKVLFGQLDADSIQRKNLLKYYRHEGSEKDKLFQKDNEPIYSNVMAYMRSKEQQKFSKINDKNKHKWVFLQNKVKLLETFLKDILTQYEDRNRVYARQRYFFDKAKKTGQFIHWQSFLKYSIKQSQKQDHANTSFYSQEYAGFNQESLEKSMHNGLMEELGVDVMDERRGVSWEVVNWFLLQKMKINQLEIVCLKERILPEYTQYIKFLKEREARKNQNRNELLQNYKLKKQEKNGIIKQIQKLSISYNILKDELQNNRIKQTNNVQDILKKEFNLKLIKIQLQNYEVKISKVHGLILDTSEMLYNHVQEETFELEEQVTNLNNKFRNYINMFAGIGQNKTPVVQKYFQDVKRQGNLGKQTPLEKEQEGIKKLSDRRSIETSFKFYLNSIKSLLSSLNEINNKSQLLIGGYTSKFQNNSMSEKKGDNKIKHDNSEAKIHYYASNIKDLKMLKLFKRIIKIQTTGIKKMMTAIQQQLTLLRWLQEQKQYTYEYKRLNDDLRKHEEELRKNKKKGQEMIIQNDQTQSLKQKQDQRVRLFLQNYRVSSLLYEIIGLMQQSEREYYKYANELASEQEDEMNKEKKNNESLKNTQKYNAYVSSMMKQAKKQFDEDSLNKHSMFSMASQQLKRGDIEIWAFFSYSLRQALQKQNYKDTNKIMQHYTYKQSTSKSNQFLNRLLSILVDEWSKSQFFHQFVKGQLQLSLNRKKPGIVDQIKIQYFKIVKRDKSQNLFFKILKVHDSQIYRCMFDLAIHFKGRIVVQIETKLKIGKGYPIQVKLLIKEFQCPIRLCFTPFSLGKSYASLLQRPKLSIDLDIQLAGFSLTKIPFVLQILKLYLVLKLRKKMLWPKRMTLSVPLSFKSTIELAIAQRIKYEADRQKHEKKTL